jgi:hypothetical protein
MFAHSPDCVIGVRNGWRMGGEWVGNQVGVGWLGMGLIPSDRKGNWRYGDHGETLHLMLQRAVEVDVEVANHCTAPERNQMDPIVIELAAVAALLAAELTWIVRA